MFTSNYHVKVFLLHWNSNMVSEQRSKGSLEEVYERSSTPKFVNLSSCLYDLNYPCTFEAKSRKLTY